MQFSVVYPAFNEEESVRETLERSLKVMRGLFLEFEIIVINDASLDKTGEIADEIAGVNSELRVLHNPKNLGQGGSLVRGFRAAKGEWVLHNAIDYPFWLEDLEEFIPLFDESDLIVALRNERAGYTAYRHALSIINVFLLNTLFDVRLSDYSFVQCYRRTMLETLEFDCQGTGFLAPSLIIQAHDKGVRVRSLETTYHPRLKGVATAGAPKVVMRAVRELFSFWWKRRRRLSA